MDNKYKEYFQRNYQNNELTPELCVVFDWYLVNPPLAHLTEALVVHKGWEFYSNNKSWIEAVKKLQPGIIIDMTIMEIINCVRVNFR